MSYDVQFFSENDIRAILEDESKFEDFFMNLGSVKEARSVHDELLVGNFLLAGILPL